MTISDTDDEFVVQNTAVATKLYILNVAGCTHLAARAVNGVTLLRVTPLDNF